MHARADQQSDLVLDALGNAVRREIVRMLADKPQAVFEIADQFKISRPAISKHLRILQEAEIISGETIGNWNIYCLQPRGFDQARTWLDQFWSEALDRYTMVAENTYEGPADE